MGLTYETISVFYIPSTSLCQRPRFANVHAGSRKSTQVPCALLCLLLILLLFSSHGGCASWGVTLHVIFVGPCNEALPGHHQDGYRGCQTKTRSGRTCQKWAAQFPQSHRHTPKLMPGKGLGDHNYCRNPTQEPGGIWCYTTDPQIIRERCNPVGGSFVSYMNSVAHSLDQSVFPKVNLSLTRSLTRYIVHARNPSSLLSLLSSRSL